MNLGERVKKVRQRFNLTQAEFAEKLGVGQSYISSLEKGKESPSDTLLFLISSLYCINIEWLKDGTGEEIKDPNQVIGSLMRIYKNTDNVLLNTSLLADFDNIESFDPEVSLMVSYLKEKWQEGRDRQGWLKIQFNEAFPKYEEWQKKRLGMNDENTPTEG
jgi:transcriptional regulator with XRE-family HTH domain